ncbi:Rho guanine nucleotide exchange factor 28 [Mactra antiquata]
MALSTKEAPVYGGGTLVIEFSEDTELNSNNNYYVVYEGSKHRHITTARILSSQKLHSIIPGRNKEEDVNISVIEFNRDRKIILTASSFHFYIDGAYHLANFLVESVFNTEALNDLELIQSDNFNLANEELSTLDKRLSRALTFCDYPDWWSLLGSDSSTEPLKPRETLLHFAARLGLNRVAAFFLTKTGSEQALNLTNKDGDQPHDVANKCGHESLVELLTQHNIQSLLPQGRWYNMSEGFVQTQDTGDVTLTTNFDTHKRTIEEDICVLQSIQKQIENKDVDISRQWQTDWPADNSYNTDVNVDSTDSLDDKYQAICEKVQELPNVLTLESIGDHDNAFIDSNLDNQYSSDVLNENGNVVTIETESSPRQQVSEGEEEVEEIMEGTLSALRGYNEHLQRIRQKSTVFNKILEQELRKGNLARFSTSCPSLDIECRNSPLPVIDEGDLCKSMVDLADDNVGENTTPPNSMYSGEVFSSAGDITDSSDNIHVIVDGVTSESTSDYGLQSQEYDQFLKDYYGGNVPQVRKRSASPVVKHSGSLDENLGGEEDRTMLIHGNKSVYMPQDNITNVNNTFHVRDDILTTNGISAGTDNVRRTLHSTGDIDASMQQPQKTVDDSSIQDDSAFTPGRGHGNKARHSADIEYLMRNMKAHHSGSSLDKMTGSTHSTGSGSESETIGMSHGKITKAFSMSSIPAATNADKQPKSLGSSYKENKQTPSYLLIQKLIAEHDSSNFSNSSTNFSSKSRDKEDKKRKTSMFSRFHSSYRKKNKDKESKNKSSSHRFVSVSFSNSTTCDVCHKQLMNKPALRCQICLVNIHENSCKDQVTACDKSKQKSQVPRQSSTESEYGPADRNNSSVSNLRPSYSFNDNSTRVQSAYVGSSTQPIPVTTVQPEVQPEPIVMRKKKSALQSASAQLQRRSLPTPSLLASMNTGTYLQWRRASAVTVDHAIVEEDKESDNVSRLDLGQSNMTETISHSIESLDEVDSVQEVRYDDVELGSLDTDEPETWTETVDKKVLKKMNPKDIKRQDTIWELIQTERHYCKRLKTLQIFFRDGLLNELRLSVEYVDRMFPQLDDLITIHMSFLRQLQDLQNRRQDRLVEEIGPTLKQQFSGDSSEKMKSAYGTFCSGHLEAVQLYKDLLAREKKFQNFIKQRSTHHLCRRREIPDFILLITQRPTKYPTLIEAVIKSTKDKKDRECLTRALDLSKDVLQSVDRQVAAAERAMKLKDIYNRLDSRSMAVHRGKKFRKMDIRGRKLLHEGFIGWKNARGKTVEVLAVVLNDVLLFLQENNQKYSFFSQDNKEGVVSLFNLLVREKRDTRDTIGIYLISQNKQCPEMYEVVFNTTNEMQKWAKILRSAVEQCPEEVEEEVQTAVEEERIRQERRAERAQKIQEQLLQKDRIIRECCEAKNKLLAELHALHSETEDQQAQQNVRPSSRDFDEATSPAENAVVLQAAIQEVSNAASQLTNMLHGNSTNLSRSVSSVGEHSSNTFTAIPIPKRADTFAGFDSHDVNRVKIKNTDSPDLADGGQSNRDSEISDLDTSQHSDISMGTSVTSILKNYDGGETDSGHGSVQSSTSSMTIKQPTSILPQDQANIAHLIASLNNIVHLTASQGTAVETLRAQLAEANERINKLSADVHDNKHKSGYRHNQLEELRNLQGVIQKEKEEWELKKTKEKRDMEQERAQLDEMKRNLDKQENDLKQQKEEFNKKREVLQKQMDLLRQNGQLPKDKSLSDLDSTDQYLDSSESKTGFVPGHRRSASAESFNSNSGENTKTVPNSSKENNFRSDAKSMSKLQSFSFGSSKQSLPVHLLSATNEQKIGSKNVQQLPSKLLGNVSNSPQQVTQTGSKNSQGNNSQSAGNQSSPALSYEHGSHGDTSSNLGHSASASQIGANQVGTSVTVPMGSRQSNRPKPSSMVASLSGVLKLSEKGDKKGKSSSSSHSGDKGARSSPPQSNEPSSQQRPKSGQPANRNPNINHKPQKSDSDVIYF